MTPGWWIWNYRGLPPTTDTWWTDLELLGQGGTPGGTPLELGGPCGNPHTQFGGHPWVTPLNFGVCPGGTPTLNLGGTPRGTPWTWRVPPGVPPELGGIPGVPPEPGRVGGLPPNPRSWGGGSQIWTKILKTFGGGGSRAVRLLRPRRRTVLSVHTFTTTLIDQNWLRTTFYLVGNYTFIRWPYMCKGDLEGNVFQTPPL